MRGGYGGMLMIGMATTLAGLALLNPISIGAGLLFGTKTVRDERKRMLQRRQAEAKQAVRRHIDEVTFQVGKDSRDMLRHTQRQLRDHYSALAEEVSTSIASSVLAAQNAVSTTTSERQSRIRDLKAELARIDALADRAALVATCVESLARTAREPVARYGRAGAGAPHDRHLPRQPAGRRLAAAQPGPLRRAAARRDRGQGEGGQVDVAQRARRRGDRADRRGRVHPRRHLVPGRARAEGHDVPARRRRRGGLTIHRDHGALRFDLSGAPVERVDKLEVQWPSQSLRTQTLIDTPGIASLSSDTSARAGAFLAPDDAPSQADAVVYLMRHLHATDVRFLESFYDQGVARATPINTIAVLSRADEIGVGRLDALNSARRIARRYRADDKIRGLCQTVVAVAGLLAQTGRTMRQQEFAALTALAALPRTELDGMLLSVDRFVPGRVGRWTPTRGRG